MSGTEGIKRLLKAAVSFSKPQSRAVALRALESITDPAISATAIEALRDESAKVRTEAARVLGIKKESAAVDALVCFLKVENSLDARLEAIKALGSIGGDQAVEAIAGEFTAVELRVQMATLSALAQTGKLAIPSLRRFLLHKKSPQANFETVQIWDKILENLIAAG
jgi:HEAT repeat protein